MDDVDDMDDVGDGDYKGDYSVDRISSVPEK